MRKASAALLIFKILKIPLVIIQTSVIAKYFGVTLDRDIWLLAISLVTLIDTAVWGPIVETFRAKFIFLKEEFGESICLKQTSSFLIYMLIISALISLILYFFTYDLAKILAPKYDNIKIEYLSKIIRLCLPFLLLNQITSVLVSILNSYSVFNIPEFSSFFSVLINIIIVLFTANYIGIYSLFFGQLFSSVVLMLFIFYHLKKKNIDLFSSDWKLEKEGFLHYFIFATPFFITYFLYNFNLFYEKKLVSVLDLGAVSILDYGSKLPVILNGITTSLTLSIFLPVITTTFVSNNKVEFNKQVKVFFSTGILILGFLISIIIVNSNDLVHILYFFSKFSETTNQQISITTSLYSIYVLFYFIYIVFGSVLLATNNRKKYVFIGGLTQVIVFLMYELLFKSFSLLTFPISNIIAYLISSVILFFIYPFRSELVQLTKNYFYVVFLSTFFLASVKYFFKIHNVFYSFTFMTLLTVLTYFVVSVLLKLEEVRLIVDRLKNLVIWK